MKHSSPAASARDLPPTQGGAAVVLPASCTLRDIAVLQGCLRGASREAALDGSAVQWIDSAAVKLLVAFIRERRAAHGCIHWCGASAALNNAVLVLGVANAVNLPTVS